jgi:glycosyltransferase involved in cell wall biosynthesis
MKVTFCSFDGPNEISGPNVWLRRLLPELRRSHGIEGRLLFLSPPPGGANAAFFREEGFPVAEADGVHCTEDIVRWIAARLREDPPDVLVPNLMVPALHAGPWVRAAGIPTVAVMHSDDPYYWAILDEFVRCSAAPERRVSALVCVSEFLEQRTRELLGDGAKGVRVERIGYGVDVPDTPASPPAADGPLRLAYVGRLSEEQKRVTDVARAMCRAAREVPGVTAALIGDGPDRAAVEAVLTAEGRGAPVELLGRLDPAEVQARLRDYHVLVLLSDYEGLPISLMEGMAAGLVPVCFAMRSGVPELVQDGANGLMVPDRGDGFVAAVRRLREERGLWGRLSSAARTRIEVAHSGTSTAARWADLLRSLAAEGTATGRSPVRLPFVLGLPPVHPALARVDGRHPALPQRAARWLLRRTGRRHEAAKGTG